MEVKAGQILNVTNGDYSDYRIVGSVKVLKDFDCSAKRKEFKETCPEVFKKYFLVPTRDGKVGWFSRPTYTVSNFISWLVTNGLAEEIEVPEFNFDYD